jgi:beta-lactamase class A
VALLTALYRGDQLGPDGRNLLIESLQATVTGPNRIRAGVPPGTQVAHKTGTLGPLSHDVGIVSLPDGCGDVAMAVLLESDAPLPERERVIAALSRAVWDRFASRCR